MSHKNAKKIRKALFKKGMPVDRPGYQKDVNGGTIFASKERRIYRALKRLPIKEVLEKISKLKMGKQG